MSSTEIQTKLSDFYNKSTAQIEKPENKWITTLITGVIVLGFGIGLFFFIKNLVKNMSSSSSASASSASASSAPAVLQNTALEACGTTASEKAAVSGKTFQRPVNCVDAATGLVVDSAICDAMVSLGTLGAKPVGASTTCPTYIWTEDPTFVVTSCPGTTLTWNNLASATTTPTAGNMYLTLSFGAPTKITLNKIAANSADATVTLNKIVSTTIKKIEVTQGTNKFTASVTTASAANSNVFVLDLTNAVLTTPGTFGSIFSGAGPMTINFCN